jgi:hypothetical protein
MNVLLAGIAAFLIWRHRDRIAWLAGAALAILAGIVAIVFRLDGRRTV